ncbi:two-component system response regulator [Planktothrix paucivesiculata]|uniref:Two-component response regulator n=1 Tax=Planktothrix paucivesiculata PCC 9631 TaxID=671071 RepID=A0A7Z9DWF4_9CYAN|nr:EAL domain-containing response regulator [Planktothrix paucivesiculata]VXD12316.1 Two-component response regulator [Planktothrix paucivesiculata PCC 9631]
MNHSFNRSFKADILIVDDTLENLRLLSNTLIQMGYKVRGVMNGQMAIMAVQTLPPDLILLDIKMPDMDGYTVCQSLKENEKTRDIPVIFLSALNEVIDKVKAFQVGGVDYITKPFQFEEVVARIENQIALQSARAEIQQLNEKLEQRVQSRTMELEIVNAQLKGLNYKLEKEISEHQKTQTRLLHLASHDALTNLPNRVLFMNRLVQSLQRTQREPNYQFGVLFLDCDRFKVVNDSLGHFAGDRLLIAIARRLKTHLASTDMLARFGGDEFTILLENIQDIDDVSRLAQKIQTSMSWPFQFEEQELFINASIGIVVGNRTYQEPEHILRDADIAMYQAKAKGKARYQIFDTQMHYHAQQRLELETDLRRALHREEFILYYQPIISLDTGRINGFEALLRWHHGQKGLISPGDFIPAAEETGLIVPIGLWVLKEACQQLKTWQDRGLSKRTIKMSVNLSVKQFSQLNLIQNIDKIILQTQLNSSYLKLEITESAIMEHPESAAELLQQLRDRDIQLSIDDFGTGYSSLSYLHRFPLHNLKIDRSFIQGISQTRQNLEIIQAIITLAHHLNMNVTAEGVETPEQLSLLRSLGCEEGQGYFFARPLEANAAEALLVENPHW